MLTGLDVLMLVLACVMEAIPILLDHDAIVPADRYESRDRSNLSWRITTATLAIGLITPLVGSVTFVMCGISRVPLMEFGRQSLPFVAVLVVGLLVITYVPSMVLFLPHLVMGSQ